MRKFYQDTLACFLADGKEENTVYSPINVYLALAMLAESGEGETQEEILDLLQIDDLDALREYVNAIWNATYDDTPESTSLLANSIWLSDKLQYNKNLLERLSKDYHASAFIGTMGTEKMNQALHDWINENTKDLLKDSADGIKLDKATVMEILSTIYFKARWDGRFLKENTNKEIFHGKNGDTEVDMMHRSTMGSVYQTTKFKGVSLELSSGTMHFILPEENVKLSDVVKDEHIMDFLGIVPVREKRKAVSAEINLSIPKFDLSSKIDLKAGLKALGVEKAFDSEQAEFQTLFAGTKDAGLPAYVDKAEHAAMVTIDEDGATGAAYTDFGIKEGAALPEETVDFVVDRPFYYVITSEDGSILFAGTAYDI
ncbi:MAG: serpin family protein [Lachnospiraceae bacterium]|nr:serpin family protein [Lachnospiraceae bacterium]